MISQFLDFIHRKVVDAIHFHYKSGLKLSVCFFLRVLTFFWSYPDSVSYPEKRAANYVLLHFLQVAGIFIQSNHGTPQLIFKSVNKR